MPGDLRTVDGSLTYAELDRLVEASRAALDALTPVGERHLVRLTPAPTVEFVVAWLAALRGGHATLLTGDAGIAAAYSTSIGYDGGWRPTGAPAPALHPDLRV